MFCPKCASQNLDGASFCRTCGANISLVPQALSGQLPQPVEQEDFVSRRQRRRDRHRKEKELSLDHAFKNAFMGLAFLFVAIALSFSIGRGWWFWMLIPAFSMFGTGIAQYIRIKENQKRNELSGQSFPQAQSFAPPPPKNVELPPRNTGELIDQPPSVTEGTTRHLGAEAPTRHLDASGDPRP